MIPILQNRKIQILILIALLLFVGFQTGFLTGMIVDTKTKNYTVEEMAGYENYELIGPLEREGFIESYLSNGLSQIIVAQGKSGAGEMVGLIPIISNFVTVDKVKYIVYGAVDTGFFTTEWQVIAEPGQTSTHVFPPCVEYTAADEGGSWSFGEDGAIIFPRYDFQIMGFEYSAIKVEFWVHADTSPLIPFSPGFEWYILQEDQATMYSGIGAMYYRGTYDQLSEEVQSRQTFEIGETVIIDVHTGFGGQTVATSSEHSFFNTLEVGGKQTWEVKLRQPSDRGGEVIKSQRYNDDVKAEFKFVVTEDMFSTESTNEYRLELYNTWIEKGHLKAYTIDLLANAPDNVEFDISTHEYTVGGETAHATKINEPCTVKFSAEVNENTQLPIAHFRVSVAYSTSGELMPGGGPSDPLWIVYTYSVPAVDGKATITFTPEKEDYITVWATPQDTEGRASLRPYTATIYAYEGSTPPPPETINTETGVHEYWGGHTPDYIPWKPSDAAWEDAIWVIVAVMMSLLAFVILTAIVLIMPIPVGPKYVVKTILIAIIAVISYLLFYYLMSDLSILADIFM